MNEQTLREFLVDADANFPSAVVVEDLAQRVRRRARRRRTWRTSSAAALLLATCVAVEVIHHTSVERVAGPTRLQLASLANQAADHERMVTQLLAAESRYDSARAVVAPPQVHELTTEREVAAAILLASGDELVHSSKTAAGERYRSVLALFPDTRIAPVAQERLAKLEM